MTEAEWLASDDPAAMLVVVRPVRSSRTGHQAPFSRVGLRPTTDRKLRLWVEACREEYHRIRPGSSGILYHGVGWPADLNTPDGLAVAIRTWSDGIQGDVPWPVVAALLRCVVGNPFRSVPSLYRLAKLDASGWSGLKRVPDSPWLTWNGGTIPRMAAAIYDDRAFDHLPVLADALEEAGCQDAEILQHCRGMEQCQTCNGKGEVGFLDHHACEACRGRVSRPYRRGTGWRPTDALHARGCWVIDLILGCE